MYYHVFYKLYKNFVQHTRPSLGIVLYHLSAQRMLVPSPWLCWLCYWAVPSVSAADAGGRPAGQANGRNRNGARSVNWS